MGLSMEKVPSSTLMAPNMKGTGLMMCVRAMENTRTLMETFTKGNGLKTSGMAMVYTVMQLPAQNTAGCGYTERWRTRES